MKPQRKMRGQNARTQVRREREWLAVNAPQRCIVCGKWFVVWSWFVWTPGMAALFSVYMILVSLLDNILRPLVMAKGLSTPMPVILVGVLGGTLAHGMIGLFIGPVVLSIAWQLLALWFRDETLKQDVPEQLTNTRRERSAS